jgi:hypothetical protein
MKPHHSACTRQQAWVSCSHFFPVFLGLPSSQAGLCSGMSELEAAKARFLSRASLWLRAFLSLPAAASDAGCWSDNQHYALRRNSSRHISSTGRLELRGNSLHISCKNSAKTKSLPQPSQAICFYLKTMRGKPRRITLEYNVLLKTFARFKPSLQNPRFKQPELGGPRRFTPAMPKYPQQRSASAFFRVRSKSKASLRRRLPA